MPKSSTESHATTLLGRIGHTPLFRLGRILPKTLSPKVKVFAKAEWFNPGGSVKDRPAYRMVSEAIASGAFKPAGQALIDSTSGNTGIAYAMIGAAMGFRVELVMPENVSPERKRIVHAYGAKVIYSDPLQGSDGARDLVHALVQKNPAGYFFPDQYSNDWNWKAHYETTGPEIWRDTEGAITHFVAGMGTSGTMMGVSRFLKEQNPKIQCIALEPEPFHGIEGWKHMDSAIAVKIYNRSVHDRKLIVPTESAYRMTEELAAKEGLLVGPSAGAALDGALTAAKDLEEGLIVVIFADGGDKYLSTQLWV